MNAAFLITQPYSLALSIGVMEHLVRGWILSDHACWWPVSGLGLAMVLTGEIVRKAAMVRSVLQFKCTTMLGSELSQPGCHAHLNSRRRSKTGCALQRSKLWLNSSYSVSGPLGWQSTPLCCRFRQDQHLPTGSSHTRDQATPW